MNFTVQKTTQLKLNCITLEKEDKENTKIKKINVVLKEGMIKQSMRFHAIQILITMLQYQSFKNCPKRDRGKDGVGKKSYPHKQNAQD